MMPIEASLMHEHNDCPYCCPCCVPCACLLQARWAYRRCGYLLAASEEYEQAVTAFQTALKGDVKDAGEAGVGWERAGVVWN